MDMTDTLRPIRVFFIKSLYSGRRYAGTWESMDEAVRFLPRVEQAWPDEDWSVDAEYQYPILFA